MATRQREKALKLAQTRDKRPTAVAKYIRITSDKVGIVLDLIRGRTYDEAVAILKNTNKSASPVILKIVNSAAANAENNLNIAKDNLRVADCWAMQGPTLKRMMPRARGSANRILKRTSHIRVILEEMEVKKPMPKQVKKASKEIPTTVAERPLTDTPNAKKPLGEKKVAPKAPAAKPAVKKESTTKPAAAKTVVKKEGK
jgi:large subunit ribosomal protein L22